MKNLIKFLFQTSRLLVVVACILLVYSFVALEGRGKEDGETDGDDRKTNRRTTENEKEKKDRIPLQDLNFQFPETPRLVFMVIDAFRLSFLTSPESPMTFTKSSIANNSALLFDAYARMPTVTLPRITAYITGTLPSFGTILTNLATDEIKIDNWISRIHALKKRIHFFGDDTWIRLLPGKFKKYDGVTSFYVNDYTEVDQNVTRHLRKEFSGFRKWDVLILHYLGLDHIGHSLGGNSPKIPEKLKEMDEVIVRIHEFLRNSSSDSRENYLIVCGDHGMTAAGSHGGASPEETRVPVVMWKIGRQTNEKMVKNTEKPPKIEQIDVSATIFDLFGLEMPSESYGISLASWFRDENFEEENLKKQHEHFKNIIEEKHLSISDICDENCDYTDKFLQKSLKKWFKTVQEELIGTSTEMPNISMFISFALLLQVSATVLSANAWFFRTPQLNLSIFLVNIMCFASSLIEEEHEIWFYLGSTVVAIRAIRWLRNREQKELKPIIALAVLHRIAYGYMQSTRRRWSMDQSLLPESLFSEVFDRNVTDFNTFLKFDAILVMIGSFIYWWIYIKKNHSLIFLPMLSQYLRYMEFAPIGIFNISAQIHILIQLCVVPIGIITGTMLFGFLPLILAIVPVSQVLLALFTYRIGHLSAKLQFGDVENLIFCMASFFYFFCNDNFQFQGNSNSLSTLSLTSAYVGLLDYYPILVGAQLIVYTFAGPVLYMAGRTSFVSTKSPATSHWLQLHFSFRISALATSLICLYIFQNHLFVWSVYSPKVVYDIAHVIVFGVISAF
ncbi:hypothetical protein CRE_01547 [Caenorhabditis remanei]|uniref:GPI ethanolamine phosphate transferase 2 C-terminal domain-containing protein n=1 Tax=Caenorhabditis remanei TaxID=31234 RepID=E3LGD4_CAERE|nr:hypothetical protein CRE_01547 [Caenorhabditis remanei]